MTDMRSGTLSIRVTTIRLLRGAARVRLALLARSDRAEKAALAGLYAADTYAELHDADVRFHAEVANATGNDLLILTLGAIAPLLRR